MRMWMTHLLNSLHAHFESLLHKVLERLACFFQLCMCMCIMSSVIASRVCESSMKANHA
jgi:hypothetical protein